MENRKTLHEQFLQDGREAWNEYITTGKYISAEAADDWPTRLESGEDIPSPEPQ